MKVASIILKLLIVFTFWFSTSNATEEMINENIEKLNNSILMAENYLWLSMDEGSNTVVDKKAQKYIDVSKSILKNLSISNKDLLTAQIVSIEEQLKSLQKVESKSLDGFYPILRYATSDFFFMPSTPKIHTLVKNPKYLAVHNSIDASTKILRQLHQRHIFINSVPHDPEVEEIAFNIFNGTDKLFSRLDKEVVTALNDQNLIKSFRENNITEEMIGRLSNYVGDDSFYLVTVNRNLTENSEYYYTISTANYGHKGKSDLMSTDAFGYSIDESYSWSIIIIFHILLLGFVLLFSMYKEKKYTMRQALLPFVFYLFGRAIPWAIIPTLLAFKPGASSHILFSSWWIFVLGIALFILPIILIKLFYNKALDYVALPEISGKGDIVGISVSAGVISFLSIPYLYIHGNMLTTMDIFALVIFSIAILFSGFIAGKTLDNNDKMDEKYLAIFVLIYSILIAIFLHGISSYIIASSLVVLMLDSGILYYFNTKMKQSIEDENILSVNQDDTSNFECKDIEQIDLRELSLNPKYQKFDYFNDLLIKAKVIVNAETTYTVLKGDGGAGKTATAKVLIDSIGSELISTGGQVLFLSSECDRHNGDEVAYSMFYDLLDSTLGVDLFGQRKTDEKFEKMISVASTFLMGPMASFLSPEEGSGASPFSKNDIYIFAKKKLIDLSKSSTVIIFIDDLQWIDSASKDLLKYLMDEFSAHSDYKIFFIFTVRDSMEGNSIVNDLNLSDFTSPIGFINKNEQQILLEKSFCISPISTKWIMNWASEQNSDHIYPYILVDAVGNLARSNVFEIDNSKFTIKKDFDFENPPIPEGPQKEIKLFMENYPQYKEVLSFASIFGKEFNVSNISYGLGITYLECIRMLDEISQEGGLVFDLLNKDDIYQFRSQIVLDAVRANIFYSNEGIKSIHVPQVIRHYHALAASALKQTEEEDHSSKLIMEIANHYYASGKLYANVAIDYLLRASNVCRKLFEYDDALKYLDKVDEILLLLNKNLPESEEVRLLIECDKSNVYGVNADKAASETLEYIEKNSACIDELKMVAVRACYDAALQNNYAQEWFAKSAQNAKEYLLSSDSELVQAEGHHFIAASMKAQTDEEKNEQLQHFYKAIELTKKNHPTAYAKIANSLAEALSYGDDDSKKEAKKLFLDSLQIKENAEIKDLPGIARTYGGLGRLAFFATPSKTVEAKEYFQKDLDVANEIGDQRGISQMNSFLGSCCKVEEDYKMAIHFYDESITLENNPFDVHASYGGKFFALDKLEDKEAMLNTVKVYEEVLSKLGVPTGFIAKNIIGTLEKYSENECKEVVENLRNDS